MNHWLTAPILIPLLGGILQALMGYAPITLRRTLALATTVLILVSAIVLLVLANDGSYRIYAFGNWQHDALNWRVVMVFMPVKAIY